MENAMDEPKEMKKKPEVKALVEKAVAQASQALAAKNSELEQKLKDMSVELAQFKNIDPAAAKSALSKVDADEEQKLMAEGRVEEVAEKRFSRARADYEDKIAKQQARIKELEADLEAHKTRLNEELVERGIKEAVAGVGEVHKDAWPDVLARGKAVFAINGKGEPEPRDAEGKLLFGKESAAQLTYAEWANELLASAPHLFASAGRLSKSGKRGTSASSGGKSGTVVISKDQAKDVKQYRSAKDRAAKLGQQLIIR